METIRGYLIEFLVVIFRLHLQTKNAKSHYILESMEYINSHYTKDIRLEELAFISNSSITNLCKLFKSLTGTTITNSIQTMRIEEAYRLLKVQLIKM